MQYDIIHPGDVLCTEYGEFLVIVTNFTFTQQLGLVNLTDYQLVNQTVTGNEIVIDDFASFVKERDVYQVRRHNTSIPEPTTPTKRYNVGPSGPFRDCNITLKMLDAINKDEFTEAVKAAMAANQRMSVAHAEDFVHYLMEDN